ncbi:hypothetical protein LXL04_033496 [Taraxacum kok-saghyz]
MVLDSFQEVDQWMKLLARKGVRELDIANLNQRYQLPSYIFYCQKLRKLKLDNCIFKPPLQFEGFLDLEELELKNIVFGKNLNGTQISLPGLKNLYLNSCTDVYNFNIKAEKLEILYLGLCADATFLLRLLDTQCLTCLTTLIVDRIIFNNLTKDLKAAKKVNFATMFSHLPRITTLVIDSHILKFLIADNIPRLLPHAINSLSHLCLLSFHSDLNQLHGALCLLRNSPNLERLCMLHAGFMKEHEVVPALDQMPAPTCLDFTLNQLRIVGIECLEGSMIERFFIKLLLAHSPSLEMLYIITSETSNPKKRYNLAKDIMRFPHASPKAQVICLDPEPKKSSDWLSFLLVMLKIVWC